VRVWEEHESPYQRLAELLRDRGIASGRVGFEESVRFYLFDGLRRAVPHLDFTSADAVTIPCRAIKSAAEVALMQRAMDITVAALRASLPLLREGMSQADFVALLGEAYHACGVSGHGTAQFGATTAFPHGSKELTFLHQGDMVLVDTSCTVEGYYSDLTRTVVFGTPTPRQRAIWELEHEAQAAAFAAAQLGAPMEEVDAAARGVIVRAGLGPGYRVPGLPHRTGHGIGLDIHEWYHIVPGNKRPLAPGMCFSDEPMITIYGEFGVRLEDCITMTESGPRFFSQPSPSIERPFA
jgi:Xaa-Pro dipeptidase